jgi:hypothetical protein
MIVFIDTLSTAIKKNEGLYLHKTRKILQLRTNDPEKNVFFLDETTLTKINTTITTSGTRKCLSN